MSQERAWCVQDKREACVDETKKLKGKAFQNIIMEVLRGHPCRTPSSNLILSVSDCKNLSSEVAFVIFTFLLVIFMFCMDNALQKAQGFFYKIQ